MPNPALESRCHKRYKVKESIIALSFDDVCRLSDISAGGAALKCIGRGDLPSKWSLDIMMTEANFHATLPVKLAWEKEVQLSLSSTVFTKLVGVQFDNLSKENKVKIDLLIKLHEEHAA